MSDWSLPSLTSLYSDFLDALKNRDFDSISLCYSGHPTNPQTGMLSYERATDKFAEYNGATWVDKVLALAGGGTGASTAAGARTNLGLGTIATQAASGVAITGGSITGLGTFTINAGMTAGSGAVAIIDSTGKIPAISSTYFASLSGANLTNLNGSNISSGTVNFARLGSGGGAATKFLREDNTWQDVSVVKSITQINLTVGTITAASFLDITIALTDYTKAIWVPGGTILYRRSDNSIKTITSQVISNTVLRVYNNGADDYILSATQPFTGSVVEYKNVG